MLLKLIYKLKLFMDLQSELSSFPNLVFKTLEGDMLISFCSAKNLTEVAKRTVGMAVSEGYLGYLLQACVDVSET